MKDYLAPIIWVLGKLSQNNPFFIYNNKHPLLHQTEVVGRILFMKPVRVLIADSIGLGKTITALRILTTINRYRDLKRVLIAVPSVLVDQWIGEMKTIGIQPQLINRKSLELFSKLQELPAGWYIGSIDTLKQPEYMAVLKRNKWDAIVVDEAHKLGMPGKEPNQRWLQLGDIIMRNREAIVLLLSATPHRGKANDYLSRLALLDPTLLEVTNIGALDKVFDKREFYLQTHNFLIFRRTKEDVNKIYERREVFKPCRIVSVLIEPNEVEKKIINIITEIATTYLSRYYTYLVEVYNWDVGRVQGIVALLRTLLIKRGLSSPQALFKTFNKLVEKRGKIMELVEKGVPLPKAKEVIAEEIAKIDQELDEILTGDIGEHEKELDEKFDEIALYLNTFLDEDLRKKLEDLRDQAKKMLRGEVEDSKLEAVKKLLRIVLSRTSKLPQEFRDLSSGKIIIFTEFKDTAYYLYTRLKKWVEEEFGERGAVQVLTSDNRKDIDKIQSWLMEDGRKVLITTDVAGEGLNLQYANVLVNYEIAWSPVRLEQRIGRVWRYGQRKECYVFNLFLADALEKEVAEVVFAKLYGITVSLGKTEPIIGGREKARMFLSTIKNELLEHAVEDEKPLGGLIPLEIDFKGRRVALSEHKIINMLTEDARAFVEAFIKALKTLAREYEKICPHPPDPEKLRSELRHLLGFGDTEEVIETVKKCARSIAELTCSGYSENNNTILIKTKDGKILSIPSRDPERSTKELLRYFSVDNSSKYYFYQSNEKKLLLLTEASIIVGNEKRHCEPVGLVADVETGSIEILRGGMLIEKLSEVLRKSLPVDEVYGLSSVLSLIPEIVAAAHNTFYEKVVKDGATKIAELARRYEEAKQKLGGTKFFETSEPTVKITDPDIVFISTAFLPETEGAPSEEVWIWAEDEAIPIVFNYEGLHGREAVRVSSYEHYDVKSVKRDQSGNIIDERYIEVKTKTRRSLSIKFTEEEARVARKKGEKYWLYLVYGATTKKPVILAIRNPFSRLPFQRSVAVEKRETYSFFVR